MSAEKGKINAQSVVSLVKYPDSSASNIDPREAFLLSRIDGKTDVSNLASICSLAIEEVIVSLEKLLSEGFVALKATTANKSVKKKSGSILDQLDKEDKNSELAAAMPRAVRQKIRLLYQKIEEMNYYQVLELAKSASAAQIKKAYLQLSKEMHPDRFFGKEIGDYKEKLDRLFALITKAHVTLSSEVKKAEYDKLLDLADADSAVSNEEGQGKEKKKRITAQIHLKPLGKMLEEEEARDPSLMKIDRQARKKILNVYRKLSTISHYDLLEISNKAQPEAIERACLYQIRRFAANNFRGNLGDYEKRRQKLIQRFENAKQILMNSAKRKKYDKELEFSGYQSAEEVKTVKSHGKNSFLQNIYRAKVYYERGLNELSKGNRGAAANNFQLAVSIAPKEKKYRDALEEVADAKEQLALDNILKRAESREKDNDYNGAIELYEKAFEKGVRSGKLYLGIARGLFSLNKDLARAKSFIERGIEEDPENPNVHCLAGWINLALGNKKEAKKAFRMALDLDKDFIEARNGLDAI